LEPSGSGALQEAEIATDLLRLGIAEDSVRVPHQAIVEFIAAVTRPIRGYAPYQSNSFDAHLWSYS